MRRERGVLKYLNSCSNGEIRRRDQSVANEEAEEMSKELRISSDKKPMMR